MGRFRVLAIFLMLDCTVECLLRTGSEAVAFTGARGMNSGRSRRTFLRGGS